MALTGKQYEDLSNAILSAYVADIELLRQFVRFRLDAESFVIAQQTKQIDRIIYDLIGYADSHGLTHRLITELYERNSGNDLVAAFYLNYLKDRADIPKDPLVVIWFPTQKPFVNRVRLRQAVRDLKNVSMRRGLLIDGRSGSGKTYSKELIDFFQNETGDFHPIYIDLTRRDKYQADEIVRRILTHMGKYEPLPQFESSDSPRRWAAQLAEIVYRKAVETQRVYWLMFDEFKKVAVQPGVIELVEELAELIGSGNAPLRLILVNYAGVLPPSVKNRFDREDVGAITRMDVREFFRQFFDRNGGATDVTIDEVTAAVWDIAALPPTVPAKENSLEAIANRIEQKVMDLLKARKEGSA
jgi:hypothetical protein